MPATDCALKNGKACSGKGFDYFTTTLSISPHKNAGKLNEIGGELAEKYGVSYLFSDFKKKNGYKRSTELSKYTAFTGRITAAVSFP